MVIKKTTLPPLEQKPKDLVPCFAWASQEQLNQVPMWLKDLVNSKYERPPEGAYDWPGWAIEEPDCVLYITLGKSYDNKYYVQILASDPPPALARRVVKRLIERGVKINS